MLVLPWLCRKTSKTTAWLIGLVGMVTGRAIVWAGLREESALALVVTGSAAGFLISPVWIPAIAFALAATPLFF